MAFRNQFRDGSLMQCTSDQQNNVIDHVTVSDEIQKLRQRLDGVIAHMLKLHNQFLSQFVINDTDRQWRRFIGQKTAIICAS